VHIAWMRHGGTRHDLKPTGVGDHFLGAQGVEKNCASDVASLNMPTVYIHI